MARVIVSETNNNTTVVEGGAFDTYTLVLDQLPTSDVTVTINAGTQLLVLGGTPVPSPSSESIIRITFNASNWNVPQTIFVLAQDDQLVENPIQISQITHTVTSVDPNYNGISISPINVSIVDNDASTAGIVITQTNNSTNVTEGGNTDTYTVALKSRPTSDVVVFLNTGSQLTTNTSTLLFTANNWNIAQTVTVTAVNDNLIEGNQVAQIQHTAFSSDTNYNNLTTTIVDGQNANGLTVNITDNDVASVLISQTGANTQVLEGSGNDTYFVVLTSQPTSDVFVQINPGAKLTTSTNFLTFNATNWNIAQTVTVTALNNDVAQGNDTERILHTVLSADPNYNSFPIDPLVVSIVDDELVGLVITQTGFDTAVSEGGLTDTYTIRLQSRPTTDVFVTLDGGTQLNVSSIPLVFNSTNWDVAQTVTVSAKDDRLIEGNHTGTIRHIVTSNSTVYNGITTPNVTVNIADNDTAGIFISQTGGSTSVTEGGITDSYLVVLTAQPTANVTVNINSGTQLSTNVSQLVFTPLNWNIAQTVAVSAVNDTAVEGNHTGVIQHTVTSSDPNFNGLAVEPFTVQIADNDVGVLINQTGGNTAVTEGGATDTYSVVLSSQPLDNVTISVSGGSQLATDKTLLVFTPTNWNVSQVVTVSAIDDLLGEGTHSGTIQHTVTSGDSRYNGLPINPINVAITDNDTQSPVSVIINQSGGNTAVAEGGFADTYTVALSSAPTSNVVINVNSGTQLFTNTTQLIFTPLNWNVAQTVTVVAVDDTTVEGAHSGTILHTVASTDSRYNNLPISPINVSITDNDTTSAALVVITESGGNTVVAEGGATDSYSVVLTSAPTSNVTLNINSGSQLSTSVSSLVFTPFNWNIAQTVTVTAVDDTSVEGTHSGTIIHTVSSLDSRYNGQNVNPVNVAITDNDFAGTPGVTIIESGGSTAVGEGGATDTYNVLLSSQPTSNVVVNINGGTQLSTNTTQLVFTPVNWNVAQTVAVSAIDDTLVEGNHSGTIIHTVSSSDPNYNGRFVNPVNVSITDNDALPLTRNSNDVFTITGTTAQTRLRVSLTNTNAFNANGAAFSVNELGYFLVDDAQGRVNGLLPTDAGYREAAISRAQVLLSGVPNFPGQISNDLQRIVEFNSGSNFRFLLVRNNSLDNVRQGNVSNANVLFGTATTQQVTNLGPSTFSIGWEDGTGTNDFRDLVVTVQPTTQATTVGTGLQTRGQGEVLDLRSFTGNITANFTVTRDGLFNNYVGFYRVTNENGGIDTNGDGLADVNPNTTNYITEAISRRVSGINLTVGATPGIATFSGSFQGGGVYAPFIIANGRPEALLDSVTTNDPAVYFPYLGANRDQNRDHIRLLGDNYFGFEDLPLGNTDFDHNDFTVKVNFA